MSENELVFSARTYCKIILHAAKYPHCTVNGVLLAKGSKGKSIEFVDAIPLFHICLNLTPMAEIALIQVDEFASRKGLVIAGYYHVQENLARDGQTEKVYHSMIDKIAANFPSACLVTLDHMKLDCDMDNIALRVSQNTDGGFKSCDSNRISVKPEQGLSACSVLLERCFRDDFQLLNDFDNHLDNVNFDWKNVTLNEAIDSLLC